MINLQTNQTQVEAIRAWNELRPKIIQEIQNQTKNCIRMKKVTVVTAPNGTTLGVMQPNDTQIFNIPYVAALSSAQIGDMVLVQYWYGMSNAIAVSFGTGDQL